MKVRPYAAVLSAALGVAVLAGCGDSGDKSRVEFVKNDITKMLIDPASAIFSEVQSKKIEISKNGEKFEFGGNGNVPAELSAVSEGAKNSFAKDVLKSGFQHFYCVVGKINSKNKMGGYAGDKVFIYLLSGNETPAKYISEIQDQNAVKFNANFYCSIEILEKKVN